MSNKKGIKYDSLKPRLDLVLGEFAPALYMVGRVGTYGAEKYTDNGWQSVDNGIERYLSAALRHYLQHKEGYVVDEESGELHLSHMAWNILAVLTLYIKENEEEFEHLHTK